MASAQPKIFQGRESFMELEHFNKRFVKNLMKIVWKVLTNCGEVNTLVSFVKEGLLIVGESTLWISKLKVTELRKTFSELSVSSCKSNIFSFRVNNIYRYIFQKVLFFLRKYFCFKESRGVLLYGRNNNLTMLEKKNSWLDKYIYSLGGNKR